MRTKQLVKFLFIVSVFATLQSCAVNSNIMFKSPKGEHAHSDSIPMKPLTDYQISVDDKISFTLSTNNGTKIIESMSGIQEQLSRVIVNEYIVRSSGFVELPVLGEVKVDGLTVAQCEDTLQKLFSKEYQEPFVQVRITNQRVIVFPGNGSDARVIPLTNSNTTLMEAIAQAGGITERGKANTVKLMRKENGVRKIYHFDLSSIDGLKYTDMIVQANDYIYVEPTADLAKGIMGEITPILSILSSALVIFTVFNNIK